MSNWIQGTMKLRGTRDNIRQFFNKCVGVSSKGDRKIGEECYKPYLSYHFFGDPYIIGTREMFITSKQVFMCGEEGVCCFNIKQPWYFTADGNDLKVLVKIADKFKLDIKLYGIEKCEEFCQELLVCHGNTNNPGRVVYVNSIEYEDWVWDCPFPLYGEVNADENIHS